LSYTVSGLPPNSDLEVLKKLPRAHCFLAELKVYLRQFRIKPNQLPVMLKKTNQILLLVYTLFFLFITIVTSAQDLKDSTKNNKFSNIKLSLSYLSNAIYYGRKDTFAIPYITPSLTYHFKNGIYLEGSLSYVATKGEGQINSGGLTLGYDFYSKNEKVSGDFYATKYFVSSASTSVNSAIKGALGGLVFYDFNAVTLSGGVDVFFSKKPDIALAFEASHDFLFGKNYNWSVAPSAQINTGSQNFYEDYFTNTRYSIKRRRRITNTQSTVIVVKNNFSVLDYEFSAPIRYDKRKWGLFVTPTYAIPVNPIKFSLNNGATYKTEVLSNTLYIEAGAYLKF
jgi:hypothetical protein